MSWEPADWTPAEVLAKLRERGVEIRVTGNTVKCHPEQLLSENLLEGVCIHGSGIKRLLDQESQQQARDILTCLEQAGVTVTLDGGKIRCRPASAIPPAVAALIPARKQELVKLLEQPPAECTHQGIPRVEWRQFEGGKHLGEFCGVCGKWLRWLRQDEANLATASAGKPAPWLHPGPTKLSMPLPEPGEDATREASLARRAEYFRHRWAGGERYGPLVDLLADTCISCGCHPIAKRGDYRCSLCVEAAAVVYEEWKHARDGMRDAVEDVFDKHPCVHVSDFDAYKTECRRRWGHLSADERMERSLQYLAEQIELFIEIGDTRKVEGAKQVWQRLSDICERQRAGK